MDIYLQMHKQAHTCIYIEAHIELIALMVLSYHPSMYPLLLTWGFEFLSSKRGIYFPTH